MLQSTTTASRRLLLTIAIGTGLAGLFSFASWFSQPGPTASPVYLLHLPLGLGVPYVLLGAPLSLISASPFYRRIYSWGAVVLVLVLSVTWCTFAVLDPLASQPFTQTVLLYGWMAGGTTYEVLLILLVASS